jgi:transposase-like protein
VEEALIEMYLAGVSVRRVEDITEALWGTRVSPSTVSDLNKKIYATIEAWRVVSRLFRTFGLAERRPALAYAVMAPLIC